MLANLKTIKKHKRKFRLSSESGAGFTLIELIVVMAVFLFIVGAAIGIFISIVQNQKKVLSEQQLLSQISYIEEYMSKALRMAATDTTGSCLGSDNEGYIYLLTHRDGTIYKGIKFINQSDSDACQEFFLDTDSVLYEKKGSNSQVALTSTNLQFDSVNPIRFAINGLDGSVSGQGCNGNSNQCGASNKDSVQPRITILLNVKIAGDCPTCNRTIQTTVSQRNLNVNNGQR